MSRWLFILCMGSFSVLNALSIEVQLGGFCPSSSEVRKIYGSKWAEYGIAFDHLTVSRNSCWRQFNLFGSVNYSNQQGSTTIDFEKFHSRIQLATATIGLKWIQSVTSNFDIYAGFAPKYYMMNVRTRGELASKDKFKFGLGGYVTIGSFLQVTNEYALNIFSGYSFKKFKSSSNSLTKFKSITNMGGFDFGVGLDYSF